MDQKDLIKWGLIAVGAYLIYRYIEDNGGLSAVLGGTPALPAGTTASTPAQIAAAQIAAARTGATTSSVPISTLTSTPVTPVSTPVSTPVATTPVTSTPVTPAQIGPVSQQMLAAATAAGEPNSLSFDQWCYYFSVVTGNACPIDPGAIPAGVYSGAGIVDRTTPTDVGTWLAIMQNQLPSLGLSAFFGLGGPRYTPAWLM